MVGKILVKGMIAGFVAGLLTFFFLHVYGEPWVDRAIAFEDAAHTAMGMAAEPELVSRETQAGFGLLTGLLVYGTAVGGLLAIAFAFARGRFGRLDERGTAMLLAGMAFIAIILAPALIYPPNPPAIGNPDTIGARTGLYFIVLAMSLITLIAAIPLARGLWSKVGGWNSTLLACGAYIAVMVMVKLVLPAINEVPETFSAETLWNFRVASLSGQAILWGTLGLAFGALNYYGLDNRRIDISQSRTNV